MINDDGEHTFFFIRVAFSKPKRMLESKAQWASFLENMKCNPDQNS